MNNPMEGTQKIKLEFYRSLGHLFYAIAAADKTLHKAEVDTLKDMVKKHWLRFDPLEKVYGQHAAHQIVMVFDGLICQENLNIKSCFDIFVNYKNEHSCFFSKNIVQLILKTARAIAAAFAGTNKSELIMLANLERELKKHIIMSYYFNTVVSGEFDPVIEKVTRLLKNEGFGILTQINIQETLKNKLDVNFKKYKILGACNPPFAYQALQHEDKIGTMLPCNIIVQELERNRIEVAAINPMVSMQAVKNKQLESIAQQVSNKLNNVIKNLENEK